MLISKKWLEEYLRNPIDISPEEFREKITSSLAEVEGYEIIGQNLTNIIVGEITNISDIPKVKKSRLVEVNTGTEKNQVICAAKNIKIGDKVPLAQVGATVLNPEQELGKQKAFEITSKEMYGIKSDGMLCSPKELGIADDHQGILILPTDTNIGLDLVEELQDIIFEIDNKPLTQRPDCFCHKGIAREVAVITNNEFHFEEHNIPLTPTQDLQLKVKIKNTDLCKRYTALTIKGVRIAESPLWLQNKLQSLGLRPVNNVVDATNYVMMDIGQPIHAFDYDKLSEKEIIVRTAQRNEKITTLDGIERELNPGNLLITEPDRAIAVAGVMGGENTEVENSTKNIILECANFEMYSTRRTSMELGLRTDASTRFEKGLDPSLTLQALNQITSLILDLAGGEISSKTIDIYPDPVKDQEIILTIPKVNRLIGIDLSKQEIISILTSLALEVSDQEKSNTSLKVNIPTFRRDLNIQEDLIEEVVRIYGYNNLEPTLPTRDLSIPSENKELEFERLVKIALAGLGYDELYTYSFVGEEIYKKTLIDHKKLYKIKNFIAPELEFVRDSLVPSVLEKVKENQRYFEKLSIYEMSKVCFLEKDEDNLPIEKKRIVGVRSQKDKNNEDIVLQTKGDLETLLNKLNFIDIRFTNLVNLENYKKKYPYLHPGYSASLSIDNQQIGVFGIIHPQVKANWSIENVSVLFELFMDRIYELFQPKVTYASIPTYQVVTKDLSFWIDLNLEIGELLEKLNKSSINKYIKGISVIDIYESKRKKDKKSVTISIEMNSKKGTMSETQIKKCLNEVIEFIEKDLKGELRKK